MRHDRAGRRHSPVDLSVSWLSLLPNPVIESEIQMLRKLEDYFVPYVYFNCQNTVHVSKNTVHAVVYVYDLGVALIEQGHSPLHRTNLNCGPASIKYQGALVQLAHPFLLTL